MKNSKNTMKNIRITSSYQQKIESSQL